MYTLIFHPEASKEFVESVGWYNQQKDGLGERFSLSVESVIKKIELIFHTSRNPKIKFRKI